MTVIKSRHQKYSVSLSNAVLQDAGLSLAAIGLWAHCMSRPEGWTFYITELCKRFKMGKNGLHKLINELIKNGFAFRGQRKETSTDPRLGKKQVFSKMEYIFFGDRITDQEYLDLAAEYALNKFQKIFQVPGNGEPQNEEPQSETLKGKDSYPPSEDKRYKKKEERGALARQAAKAAPPEFLYFDRVKLKPEEHKTLLEELGEARFKKTLTRLMERALTHYESFKRYSSHAAIIRKWAKEDAEVEKKENEAKETNQEWATKLLAMLPPKANTSISIDASGVTISFGTNYRPFAYKDKDFKKNLWLQLKSMNLVKDKV